MHSKLLSAYISLLIVSSLAFLVGVAYTRSFILTGPVIWAICTALAVTPSLAMTVAWHHYKPQHSKLLISGISILLVAVAMAVLLHASTQPPPPIEVHGGTTIIRHNTVGPLSPATLIGAVASGMLPSVLAI